MELHFISIFMDIDCCIGFDILKINNHIFERSLIAINYDTFGDRLFLNLFWIKFVINF